jgi:hypothetical protein
MYTNTSNESMSDAQKTVATYLDSLNVKWQCKAIVYLRDDEGGYYHWPMDFNLYELSIYLDIVTGDDAEDAMKAGLYKAHRLPVVYIDLRKTDWQEDILNYLQERCKYWEEILARL